MSGERLKTYEAVINFQDSLNEGFLIEASTMIFWMEQGEAARKKIFCEEVQELAPSALGAIQGFSDFMFSISPDGNVRDTPCIWANGQDFDISILRAYYDHFQIPYPWEFWKARDVRSICDLADFDKRSIKRGTLHDALEDAIWASKVVTEIFQGVRAALDVTYGV